MFTRLFPTSALISTGGRRGSRRTHFGLIIKRSLTELSAAAAYNAGNYIYPLVFESASDIPKRLLIMLRLETQITIGVGGRETDLPRESKNAGLVAMGNDYDFVKWGIVFHSD